MATPAAIVAGAQRVSIASARLDAVGEALATRVSGVTPTARRPPRSRGPLRTRAPLGHAGSAPHAGAADQEHRLRASCQTVGTAAECVVTVRVISSLRVSVALILCG